MRTRLFGRVVGLLILMCGRASAQERPDFSGTWTAVSEPAAPGASGGAAPVQAYGPQFTIHQQGPSLTLSRNVSAGPATVPYVLDGSETTSRMPGRLCGPDSGATWTASWDGNAVVLAMVGALPPNGKPIKMDVRSVLRLESPDTLRVEVTSHRPGQAEPRTSATIYKRTGPAPPAPPKPAPKVRATLAQIGWLSGVWIGTAGTSSVEERWTPPAGGSMLAVSRTVRDGMMGSFEFLCLVERDGGLVYQAMPNGRMPATDFALTQLEGESATFENPTHDFPKMIRYTKRPDGALEAVISGDANRKPVTFTFKRQE